MFKALLEELCKDSSTVRRAFRCLVTQPSSCFCVWSRHENCGYLKRQLFNGLLSVTYVGLVGHVCVCVYVCVCVCVCVCESV